MNRKMTGEATHIRASDRKQNPTATKRGNVPTHSWRANPLLSVCRALRRPTATASRKKSRQTAEESRIRSKPTIYRTQDEHAVGLFFILKEKHIKSEKVHYTVEIILFVIV